MKFNELGLSDKVLKAVESSGYDTPTPIQEQAIPYALAGRDVLGIAQTGTGKTAAFTLPMLSRLEQGRARARMPRTLILEPTRELAAQVEESFVKYGVNHKLSVALLIGGVSFGDQETKITRGADVLIATPGRLLDFVDRGKLLLTGIEILVIDEADRMLDMGFIPDIERICKLVPFTRQTLFFSATMPPEITRLVDTFLQNPARVEVARAATTAETIVQALVRSGSSPEEKRATLRGLVRHADNFKNAIIFCNRKRDVAVVYRSLQKHGFSVGALHGDMDQRSRTAALDSFRNDEVQLLVCSDVAARGLDIPDVSHVINYDTPHHAEDYVHRIGRTGRAGKQGAALTIVARADTRAIEDIEKLINRKIDWAAGDAASVEEEAEPREERSDSRRGRGRSGERGHGRSRRPAREPREGAAQAGARHEPQENPDLREHGESRERQDLSKHREPRDHREPRQHREPRERHEASAHREPRERHEAHNRPSHERPSHERPNHERPNHERPSHERPSHERPSHEARERQEAQSRPSREPRERHESQGRPSREQRERHESQGRPSREQRERGGHRSNPRRQENDRPIVGLGDHVPSFLLRPVKVAPPKVEVEADD